MPICKFMKNIFHISSCKYFAFIFSECITITSSEEALVLLPIYLLNCDSSKSTFIKLNMAFDVILSTGIVSANRRRRHIKILLCLSAPLQKVYMISNNHGQIDKSDFSVLDWKLPSWTNFDQKIKIISLS